MRMTSLLLSSVALAFPPSRKATAAQSLEQLPIPRGR